MVAISFSNWMTPTVKRTRRVKYLLSKCLASCLNRPNLRILLRLQHQLQSLPNQLFPSPLIRLHPKWGMHPRRK
eukprot:scaffold34371_cov244-Skeletonema_dohrnii-CCMP3373.AAC.1